MSNKEMIIQLNQDFANNNADALLEKVTDNIIWNMVGDKILKGKDEIKSMTEQGSFKEKPEFTMGDVIEEGNKVSAVNQIMATLENGDTFNRRWSNIYTITDGKISYIESFPVPLSDEYLQLVNEKNIDL